MAAGCGSAVGALGRPFGGGGKGPHHPGFWRPGPHGLTSWEEEFAGRDPYGLRFSFRKALESFLWAPLLNILCLSIY